MDREVSSFKSQWMEELLRVVHSKVTSMDQEAIETNSQKLRWIENAITTIEKGRSRSSIDSLVVERYREAVKIAQK